MTTGSFTLSFPNRQRTLNINQIPTIDPDIGSVLEDLNPPLQRQFVTLITYSKTRAQEFTALTQRLRRARETELLDKIKAVAIIILALTSLTLFAIYNSPALAFGILILTYFLDHLSLGLQSDSDISDPFHSPFFLNGYGTLLVSTPYLLAKQVTLLEERHEELRRLLRDALELTAYFWQDHAAEIRARASVGLGQAISALQTARDIPTDQIRIRAENLIRWRQFEAAINWANTLLN